MAKKRLQISVKCQVCLNTILLKTNAESPNFTNVCMVGDKFLPHTIQTSEKISLKLGHQFYVYNDHSIASGCQNATLKKFEFWSTFVLIYFSW